MEIILLIVAGLILAQTTYLLLTSKKSHSGTSKNKQKPIFVDTSILIDGRIIGVAKTGFITSTLYIPRSVVSELQLLADTADADKRARARQGLDAINILQADPNVSVEIFHDNTKATEGVDNHLLTLARKYNGSILTLDFNLNKVAQVDDVQVLNLNDLAMNLRLAFLPGERASIDLSQKGNDSHQAVGYLPDGTMVVVEQAAKLIGKTVEVEFTRALQTTAGKMMFAKLISASNQSGSKKQTKKPTKTVMTRPKQNPRKKKTHEDSMVELANR